MSGGYPVRRALLRLMGVAVLSLAGHTAVPAAQVIRMGLSTSAVTLDPRFATDAVSQRICRLLYRPLVDFDQTYHPVPALADWQKLTPTHYRFTLRSDRRRFSDGTRLTATDVKATYDDILSPAKGSPLRSSLAMIDHIEAADAAHVDFFLNRADALFPGRLTIGILPRHLIDAGHAFAQAPVGSGPLRFEAEPDDSHLILRRIADDARIEFLTVPNPTVRALKLARGEIDLLQGDLPPELFHWLAAQPGIRVAHHPGDTVAYLGFNMRDPLVGQAAVRTAIAHAVNVQAIIRHVLNDDARPATGLLPPEHWAADPAATKLAYDPDAARRLLETLGYNRSHPLQLVYKTSNDPLRVRIATVIQAQLREVGIDVDLRSYDWGTFYGDIKAGRFQMYSLAWVGLKLPDIFRYVFHSTSVPPNGANRGRYANPRVDRLIEAAESADDLETQARDYRRVAAVLRRDLPQVPLWYEDVAVAERRDLRGYTLTTDGSFDGLIQVTHGP